MPQDKRTPAHKGTGAVVNSNVTVGTYSTTPSKSTAELAAAIVAQRYRLTQPLARAIVELADLGGRFA